MYVKCSIEPDSDTLCSSMQGDFAGYASPGPIARALVLALSVCYHARLQNRAEYEDGVATHFRGPIQLQGGAQQFRDEIRWCVALMWKLV